MMTHSPTSTTHPSGFIALHGNRIETLLDTVAGWLSAHPLDPLELEILLVQSNGMAEWVKMALARHAGVCAATSVQLPARFQWHTYRQVLGRAQVPSRSPLDKTALAWRLMRLLPDVLTAAGFEPLAAYLAGDDPAKRFQLALRIADLYDQYQVHRPDWLEAWGSGREVMIDAGTGETPLPPDQLWQARLWQRVIDELDETERGLTRHGLHRRTLDTLATLPSEASASLNGLPRRVVLFGMTHVPLPVLELLAALSRHTQVLLAVPNPCRFHWADIIEGREWLRIARRRQPLRGGRELQDMSLDAMHLHAHPLLAAWGRQARDFVRQLDAFDDVEQVRARFPLARIDLFDDEQDALEPNPLLLTQVQRHIRDLLPLGEHPRPAIDPDDRSIVFHLAHSPVRELEVLHDQLLALLAAPPKGKTLCPRDIVVMVPAIDDFAPAIRAVFGQFGRHDPRHIPFDIADLSARESNPLMTAVEWVLRLPHERCRLSDLSALLEVPAIAGRFGIDADALPRLTQWMNGAGIRWGLDLGHRERLELAACDTQNTALFGLQRMLMGFAVGASGSDTSDTPFADIEPYDEVGGLDAELAGGLTRLVTRLIQWQVDSQHPAKPALWAEAFRTLLADLVLATEDIDRNTLVALDDALKLWLDACDDAGFDESLPLDVAAQAWLDALESPALNKRFRAGGVTFCTLMPMRAIPFEVVCLLGMNDGDYPRRSPRSDFDLLALPGQHRPGDRARRDDDRQLMLEALLSARRVLYVSWCGFNVRDNSSQPPSVLVAQLRDYLAAGWSPDVLEQRTTAHPLQPFSRRYFEAGTSLLTYAREWCNAHVGEMRGDEDSDGDGPQSTALATTQSPVALPSFIPDPSAPLSIAQLARFLRNPVKAFFRERLSVIFDETDEALPDDEAFGFGPLEAHALAKELAAALIAEMAQTQPAALQGFPLEAAVARQLSRIERAGRLPMGGFGARERERFEETVLPLLEAWRKVRIAQPADLQRLPLSLQHGTARLEDWLDPRIAPHSDATEAVWLDWTVSKLIADSKKKTVRSAKLLQPWLRMLLAAACGATDEGLLIGPDATLRLKTIDKTDARTLLVTLIEGWQEGLNTPLPIALDTALAWAGDGNAQAAYEGNDYRSGEVEEPCLARCYPDFDALTASGEFERLAQQLYAPLAAWVETHVEVTLHTADDTLAMAEESV